MLKKFFFIYLLCFLILFSACGQKSENQDTSAAESMPEETITQEEYNSRRIALESMLAEEGEIVSVNPSYDRIYKALCSPTEGSELQDLSRNKHATAVSAFENSVIYQLNNNSVNCYYSDNGQMNKFLSIQAGFGWEEEYSGDSWSGHEKVPYEIYTVSGRLAVISEYFEYYTSSEKDDWIFGDNSHLILDIYDIVDEKNPTLIASYGQDGEIIDISVSNNQLNVLTSCVLDPSEQSSEDGTGILPFIYNGESKSRVLTDNTYILGQSSNNSCILFVCYDLSQGTINSNTAVLGNNLSYELGNYSLSVMRTYQRSVESENEQKDLLSLNYTDLLLIPFNTNRPSVFSVPGEVSSVLENNNQILCICNIDEMFDSGSLINYYKSCKAYLIDADSNTADETLISEDNQAEKTVSVNDSSVLLEINGERILVNIDGNDVISNNIDLLTCPVWLSKLEDAFLTMEYTDDQRSLVIRYYKIENENITFMTQASLGYDFLISSQYPDACFYYSDYDAIWLLADDSYAFYSIDDTQEITYQKSVFTSQPGYELKFFIQDGIAYIADSSKLVSVDLSSYTVIKEK